MKLIYIAGPFSAPTREGVEQNIRNAVEVALEVARVGGFPVCPHANTAHPDFEKLQPYTFWIEGTLDLLLACHALITVKGWEGSNGAMGEVRVAQRKGLPVFHDTAPLLAWLQAAELNA